MGKGRMQRHLVPIWENHKRHQSEHFSCVCCIKAALLGCVKGAQCTLIALGIDSNPPVGLRNFELVTGPQSDLLSLPS